MVRKCPPGSNKSFAQHYTETGTWPSPYPSGDRRYPALHPLGSESCANAYLKGEAIPKDPFWQWAFAAAYREGGFGLLVKAIEARAGSHEPRTLRPD